MALLATLVSSAAVAGEPSTLQIGCAPREAFVKGLAERFNEQRNAIGLASNGAVVELYASPNASTWTILITLPNGTSCQVLDGEAWEAQPVKAAGHIS